MKGETGDPLIDEIRAIRHEISAQFNHDPGLLVDHYIKMEQDDPEFQARLKGPLKPRESKGTKPPPMPDPIVDEVRAIRHKISAQFNHDPKLLVEHYMKMQEEDPAIKARLYDARNDPTRRASKAAKAKSPKNRASKVRPSKAAAQRGASNAAKLTTRPSHPPPTP